MREKPKHPVLGSVGDTIDRAGETLEGLRESITGPIGRTFDNLTKVLVAIVAFIAVIVVLLIVLINFLWHGIPIEPIIPEGIPELLPRSGAFLDEITRSIKMVNDLALSIGNFISKLIDNITSWMI